jgi:hypothetical protein
MAKHFFYWEVYIIENFHRNLYLAKCLVISFLLNISGWWNMLVIGIFFVIKGRLVIDECLVMGYPTLFSFILFLTFLSYLFILFYYRGF